MGCTYKDGKVVDHIDHNTLDNRKCNLRVVSYLENNRNSTKPITNTSGYKGVYYRKKNKTYNAVIVDQYEKIHIGSSRDAITCARMYDVEAIKRYGEYANTNFPKTEYTPEMVASVQEKANSVLTLRNTSGYRGVVYHKRDRKWVAKIEYRNKGYNGAYRDTPEEAAQDYNEMAVSFLGEKAVLNILT
jgi:hypothetical protein